MDRIEINYRALLAVAVVLNSQRDMHSLWGAITAEITKVIPWARASVTLYDHEADGFRFYVNHDVVAGGATTRCQYSTRWKRYGLGLRS